MSCTVDVPTKIQQEGLDAVRGDAQAIAEVGAFLLALQDNPFPAGREQLSPGDHTAFWIKLPCGVYVSWEIEASLLDMIALIADPRSSDMSEVGVKVLGVGRDKPAKK
jgi:hypothetical protein